MAESPAQLHAEIEKYQQKHDENPDGRYFVPLANAYRKLGEFDAAESLLREGLRRHPDYLSAHIVLGRTLADRGDRSEATAEFQYVLGIDPQNLIALRSLGELAAAAGQEEEAGHWFRELLAVDPMNDDARQSLAELEGPEDEEQEASGFESSAAWWQSPAGQPETAETSAFDSQDDHPAGHPAASAEESLDGVSAYGLDWSLPGDATDEAEPDEAEPDESEPDESEPVSELSLDWDSSVELSTELGEQEDGVAAEETVDEEPLTLSLDWQADEEDSQHDSEAPAAFLEPAQEFPSLATEWQAEEPPVEAEFDTIDEQVEAADHLVTETMAELYASQGFRAEAAEVYRELVRRRGEEPALVSRLAELESEEETGAAHSVTLEADSFAESFRNGFGGVNGESEPGDLLLDEEDPGDLVFLPGADASDFATDDETDLELAPESEVPVSEPEPLVPTESELLPQGEPVAAEAEPELTVAEFFAGLLAWRPARAPAVASHTAPAPEPLEEPEPFAEPEPFEAAAPEPTSDPEPVAAAPSASHGEEDDDDLFPWELPAEPATGGREDEPVGAAPDARGEEPEIEPGVEEAPEPEPTPERAEVAPPSAASAPAEDDDDDLESFQTWLRSLKR